MAREQGFLFAGQIKNQPGADQQQQPLEHRQHGHRREDFAQGNLPAAHRKGFQDVRQRQVVPKIQPQQLRAQQQRIAQTQWQ